MTGQAHWLDVLVIFGGAAILFLVLALGARRVWVLRRMKFSCPVTHETVECAAWEDKKTGVCTGIEECSGRPAGQRCSEMCLAPINRHELDVRAV